jgi:hypothetical protein
MWRAVLVLFLVSAGLFAALTLWTSHTTAATAARSRAFVQQAKTICTRAPRTAAGVERASRELAELSEPPNVHRAVARLRLHWARIARRQTLAGYRREARQVRLSAHLLNVQACESLVPR